MLEHINDLNRLIAQTKAITLMVGSDDNIRDSTEADLSNALLLIYDQVDRIDDSLHQLTDELATKGDEPC